MYLLYWKFIFFAALFFAKLFVFVCCLQCMSSHSSWNHSSHPFIPIIQYKVHLTRSCYLIYHHVCYSFSFLDEFSHIWIFMPPWISSWMFILSFTAGFSSLPWPLTVGQTQVQIFVNFIWLYLHIFLYLLISFSLIPFNSVHMQIVPNVTLHLSTFWILNSHIQHQIDVFTWQCTKHLRFSVQNWVSSTIPFPFSSLFLSHSSESYGYSRQPWVTLDLEGFRSVLSSSLSGIQLILPARMLLHVLSIILSARFPVSILSLFSQL